MHTHRLVVGLLGIVGLLGVASAPLAVGHLGVDTESRIVVADDRDPRAGELPPFVPAGPHADGPGTPSLAAAATMRDIYYWNTTPAFRFGPNDRTLQAHRRSRLRAIDHNRTSSRWPAHAPQPRDGVVVKDAYIAFMGASGAQLTVGRTNTSEPYLLPRSGVVYSLLDYRVGAPAPICEDLGDRRRCVAYEVVNRSVVRRLSIGGQTWVARGREHRAIEYANLTARDVTTLRLSATITVTVDRVVRVVEEGGDREVRRRNRTRLTDNLTVTDTRRVAVTTNQPLRVTQHVITTTDGDQTVVLAFDGPRRPAARRLWSTAHLGNVTLHNVWGVYSQRRSTNATIATSNGSWPYDLPHVLGVHLTARTATPTLDRANDRLGSGPYPQVGRVPRIPVSNSPARLGPHVNLTTAPASIPTRVVIEDAPGRVRRVEDIHGDPIAVTTRTYEQRPTTLTVTRLNGSHARVRLRDATTGRPLPARPVTLQHAVQERVVTDADGTAVIERAGLYVRATYPGTTLTAGRSQYYAPAQAAVTFPTPFSLYEAILSLMGAFLSVIGFVVLYVPLRIVFGN